jgi:prepilin-type N-terminal cleavage/methylation domain-containing protein
MFKRSLFTNAGFTFIELLAVIVIVGIVSVTAFLIFQGKREDARTTAAILEMKQMANAEIQVEGNYGVFVPLAVLNDTPGFPSDYPGTIDPDCIGNYSYNYYVIDPDTGYSGSDLLNYPNKKKQIRDLFPDRDKARKWKGPFITYQRMTTQNPTDPRPVDPWGMEYILFTRQYSINFDGQFGPYSNTSTERMVIVSSGKNRFLEFPNSGDDVVYVFK